jgi:hypothetical protein
MDHLMVQVAQVSLQPMQEEQEETVFAELCIFHILNFQVQFNEETL